MKANFWGSRWSHEKIFRRDGLEDVGLGNPAENSSEIIHENKTDANYKYSE